jgi:hypothetical protein
MMAETCSTCRWSKEFNIGALGYKWDANLREHFLDRADHFILRCHKALPASDGFPRVQPDDFCGEWKAKPGPRIGRHDPYPGYDPLDMRPLPADQGGEGRIPWTGGEWAKREDEEVDQSTLPTAADVRGILTTPPSEGWIPWAGGECPVAEDTFGMVRFRGGAEGDYPLWLLGWNHVGNDRGNIIAYRVHKPADFRLEAGKYYITATGERVGPVFDTKGENGLFMVKGRALCWLPDGRTFPYHKADPRHDIVALAADQTSGGGE